MQEPIPPKVRVLVCSVHRELLLDRVPLPVHLVHKIISHLPHNPQPACLALQGLVLSKPRALLPVFRKNKLASPRKIPLLRDHNPGVDTRLGRPNRKYHPFLSY